MLRDSEKLLQQIKDTCKREGSKLAHIPTLYNMVPSGRIGTTHKVRVANYKSNLHSLEQFVLDEMRDLRLKIYKHTNPKEKAK